PLRDLVNRPGVAPGGAAGAEAGRRPAATTPAVGLEVGEIVVRGGTVAWRDEAVSPPGALGFSRLEARVTGVGWPLRGPVNVRAALRPPGGGQLQLAGRLGVDPLSADLRLAATDAEIAPYQAYLPTSARISGRADADLTAVLPPTTEGAVIVRGRAAVSGIDVRDEERTMVRVERVAVTGLEVEWPR